MMKTRWTRWTIALLAVGWLAGECPAADPAPRQQSFRDRYQILSDYNIFVRDRRGPVRERERERERPVTRPAPRPIEMSHVLRGIVLEEGEYRAYVENTDARSMLRLRENDSVARGRVALIDIDAIAYEVDGQFIWVTVGSNLMGDRDAGTTFASGRGGFSSGASGSGSSATGASTTRPSLPPLPEADNPNLSMEERLRLRRAQELNRQ